MNPWQALAGAQRPAGEPARLWGGMDLADRMRALHPLYQAHDAVIRERLKLPPAPVPQGAAGNVLEGAKAAASYRLALDKLPSELRAYVLQWDQLYAGERVFYLETTYPVPTGISLGGMDIAKQFEADLASMRAKWEQLTGDQPIPLGRVENPPAHEPGLLEQGGELLKWGTLAVLAILGLQALKK